MQGSLGGEANEMSMRISFMMMNDVLHSCFKDCVTDYRHELLNGQEKSCLNNCAKRSFGLMRTFGEI